MKNTRLVVALVTIALASGCINNNKKEVIKVVKKPFRTEQHYLYLNNNMPVAIIRLECRSCQLFYQIGKKRSKMEVKNGSVDKFIYPAKESILKTTLHSDTEQMIRVLIINPNGIVVSNNLEHFTKDKMITNRNVITYVKKPKMILLKSMIKD